MNVVRGDIFFASLDPVIGVEQSGMRPVLVAQNDEANARIPTVTVVPLTSNLHTNRFLFTVSVPAAESGLPKDSVALVFQVRTLDKSRLTHKAGHLSDVLMAKIDQALVVHFGL